MPSAARTFLDGDRRVEESTNLFDSDSEEDEDDNENSKKRTAPSSSSNDAEIAELYEKTTVKKRKPRPTLTVEHLTGADGLLRMSTEFPNIKCRSNSVPHTAAYAQALLQAYSQVCGNLWPGQHVQDVYMKIEQLGQKAATKKYVGELRNLVTRNVYLEKVMGRDAAEQLLAQVEERKQQSEEHMAEAADNEVLFEQGNVSLPAPSQPREEAEALTDAAPAAAQQPPMDSTGDDDDDALLNEMEAQVVAQVAAKQGSRKRFILEDSDDEEEAVFGEAVDDKDMEIPTHEPAEEGNAVVHSTSAPEFQAEDDDMEIPTDAAIETVAKEGKATKEADILKECDSLDNKDENNATTSSQAAPSSPSQRSATAANANDFDSPPSPPFNDSSPESSAATAADVPTATGGAPPLGQTCPSQRSDKSPPAASSSSPSGESSEEEVETLGPSMLSNTLSTMTASPGNGSSSD